MDSAVDREPAPPAGVPGISPWVLAALARPAALTVAEQVLPTAARLWLEWALSLADRALERALERAVDLEIVGPAPIDAGAAVFGVSFSQPAIGQGLIALDLETSRMIVDSMESDFANVRGSGALSGAEEGLLEYATLACLDEAHRDSPQQTKAFAVQAFAAPKDIAAQAAGKPAVLIRVTISGRQGRVWVFLPSWVGTAPPPAEDANPVELTDVVELSLGLPGVALAKEEFERLAVGDVLLLGAQQLQGFAANCAIMTGTMWRLGTATVVNDTPTVVTVTCGTLKPQVQEVKALEGAIVVQPLLGKLPVTLEQLQLWQPGATIDLPKGSPDVELYCGLERIGRGELVKVEGELGIRVAERTAAGGT